MFGMHRIALSLVTVLLPGLLYATAVAALDDSKTRRTTTSASGVPEAPVGHRQPTAADVAAEPKDADAAARDKRERAIDKKLLICRGC